MRQVELTQLKASDVMSRDVIAVTETMTVKGAAHLLLQSRVSGVPVVNEEGRCTGVLSATDFIRLAEREPNASLPLAAYLAEWHVPEREGDSESEVRSHMTDDPVLASPDTRLPILAQMMVDAHVHRVIVVDEDQKPVGVVSSMDILAALARLE